MKLILFAAVVLSVFAAPADGYRPEQWNLDARRNFAAQRFGVFIHWGLYANYAQGEWYRQQASWGPMSTGG